MKARALSILKKLGYFVAGFIILAALLVSLSRLLSPVLDTYRPQIEKQASELLGVPVRVGHVEITWYQYQPGINLKDVVFLDKKTQTPAIEIKKLGVFFSLPRSLWRRQMVLSGLVLVGSDIDLIQAKSGEIMVRGLPSLANQQMPSETKFEDVAGFLSSQPRLILRNIDVHYTSLSGEKRYVTLYNLSFKNAGEGHTILGQAILHQDLSTDVTLAVQWEGKAFDLSQIKAKVYLYVTGFSFSQWLKSFSLGGWHVNKGIGSAKIWATWDKNTLAQWQTTFQLYDLALYSDVDKSIHHVTRLSGNVGMRRNGNQQIIAGDDILIDLTNHLWPVTSFYVELQQGSDGVYTPKLANVGYVDLSDIQEYLFASPTLSDDNKKIVKELKIDGALQNAAIVFGEDWTNINKLSVVTNVENVSFSPWKKIPGINHLSGKLNWGGERGELFLRSNQVEFKYASIFLKPLNIEQLTADIKWQKDLNNNWAFSIPSMQLMNPDVIANINGLLTIMPDGEAVADLKGNFSLQNASHVTRYLPMKIFDADLIEWLQEAFLSGDVQSGNVVINGKLSDFPFDKNNGVFLITATTHNIDLRFAPDWPLLKKINAKLIFSGRQMSVDVDRAETFGIPIKAVHASIPYFGDEQPVILYVNTEELQADLMKGIRYVEESPLKTSIGKMFAGAVAEGEVGLKLNLTVPLSKPENTQVKGNLALKNNNIKLVPWNLNLAKLTGNVQFTEDSSTSDQIQALLFNKPVQIKLSSIKQAKDVAVTRANFDSNIAISDLEDWLKFPFSKVVNGQTPVNGYIDISPKIPLSIHLQSNLNGLTIDLPDNFSKQANETKDFTADISVEENQPIRIKAVYGNMLSSAMLLRRVDEHFKISGINLHLGVGDPEWPKGEGLFISGNIDQLSWDKIKQYAGGNNLQSGGMDEYSLREINVNIDKLNLPAQTLEKVNLQLTPSNKGKDWDIKINSADVSGAIHLPANLNVSSTLSAQFDKLHLRTNLAAGATSAAIDVKALPAISLSANNVSYNDMSLGRVTLKTVPGGGGAVIQTLNITSPTMDFQSSGTWTKTMSRLHGKLKSSNVSDFLNSIGTDAHNFVAKKGSLDFDLSWSGALFAPKLASMNGTIAMNLGAGRIVEVGQSSDAKLGIGRLLSIFSLQTIPRRLTLDFSDLFQKGYSFDSLTGTFSLKNGNAYTSNMHFSGTVARVEINGRIGLGNQDLDITLTIVPGDVTSSLPVAATLITGPVGGIAALAVNSVIGSQISQAAIHQYTVKGPWSNPDWASINVKPNTAKQR